MKDCLFCKIVAGEIPSEKIYEDEKVLVFKDIHPVAPVHVLIIPKVHITNMNEVNSENSHIIARVFEVIPELAKQFNMDEKGYRIICNCGEDGGQVVNHLHYHLIGGKHLGMKLVKED